MMEKFLSYIGFMTHDEKEAIQQEIKNLEIAIGNTRELIEGLKSEIRSLRSENTTQMNQMASESKMYANRSEESIAGLKQLMESAHIEIKHAMEMDREKDDRTNNQVLDHLTSLKSEIATQQSEITKQFNSLLLVAKESKNAMNDATRKTWESIMKELLPRLDKTVCKADLLQELEPMEELLRLLVASQLMNIATTEKEPQSKILRAN